MLEAYVLQLNITFLYSRIVFQRATIKDEVFLELSINNIAITYIFFKIYLVTSHQLRILIQY